MSDQMTIRLDDKQEIERGIRRLEIEYDEILDAYPYEIYTAMFRLALDNPDMLAAKLEEVRDD